MQTIQKPRIVLRKRTGRNIRPARWIAAVCATLLAAGIVVRFGAAGVLVIIGLSGIAATFQLAPPVRLTFVGLWPRRGQRLFVAWFAVTLALGASFVVSGAAHAVLGRGAAQRAMVELMRTLLAAASAGVALALLRKLYRRRRTNFRRR